MAQSPAIPWLDRQGSEPSLARAGPARRRALAARRSTARAGSARPTDYGSPKKRPGRRDTGLHGTFEAVPTDRQSGHERFPAGRRNDRDLDAVGRSDLPEGNRARLIVAPRAYVEEGMHEAGIPPSQPPLEDKALHTLGGPSHKAHGPREKCENVSTAAVYRMAHWNRVGNAAVNVRHPLQQHARIVEWDDGSRHLEQSEQGRTLLLDVDDPPSSVRRVGDRHEEARPRLHHALDRKGLDARHHLINEEIHIQDLAAAQGVDEAEGCQIFEIDPATKCSLAGKKITCVDRPCRFAVDVVEHRGQPDAFHGDQCSSGDDATHASALDDEPELRVEPPKLAAFLEETETSLDLR